MRLDSSSARSWSTTGSATKKTKLGISAGSRAALPLTSSPRITFYEHFANKSECLTAAASELVEPTLAALGAADRNGGSREASEVFEAFFALLRSQPAAARVCFVELHAAGEAGEAIGDQGVEALAAAVEALSGGPMGDRPTDPELVRALIAGLRKLIHTRLARGEEAELEGLAPELWQWLASVAPPPGPLAVPRRQRAASAGAVRGLHTRRTDRARGGGGDRREGLRGDEHR